jgi:Cytochrome c551/c552
MKLATMTLLLASLVLAVQAAQADEALAKSKGCLGCHAVDKKILGPAYKDVAAKYAGQDVVDQLAQKVMKGGGGVWGQMPMPANSVTPEEAKRLVQWVLSKK